MIDFKPNVAVVIGRMPVTDGQSIVWVESRMGQDAADHAKGYLASHSGIFVQMCGSYGISYEPLPSGAVPNASGYAGGTAI